MNPSELGESAPLLTVSEVAKMLSVSPTFVRDHSNGRRRPQIRSVKIGKCRRFRGPDVVTFIEESVEFASR